MGKTKQLFYSAYLLFCLSIFGSCKSGPFNLVKPSSPHEQYERKLLNAGLAQTAMGTAWLNSAEQSLQRALSIQLPYQEKGYFSAERVEATAFRFRIVSGERLQVNLTKKQAEGFMIYVDLWEPIENGRFKRLAAADTIHHTISFDVERTGDYILRLQPELLTSGEFTLSITRGASLAYPLKTARKNQIQSIFGDGRDANTRKHEGVDIFAAFRTPVIAVAPGVITRVNVTNLGGKVVWLRPVGKNYTVYYAHLDEQTVTEGQSVLTGDTVGRMGNTGNAISTPPHLHFGIYTNMGAVDPLPFINPWQLELERINVGANNINTMMRTISSAAIGREPVKPGTVLHVSAVTAKEYRVDLPDGKTGYLSTRLLVPADKPLARYKLKSDQLVYDKPDTSAAVKFELKAGKAVEIMGNFGNYQLMLGDNSQSGWIRR